MPLIVQDIRSALMDCYDPEIPINIVDLGLVYRIELVDDSTMPRSIPMLRVEVDMSLTTPDCPAHTFMLEQVRNRLAGVPGVSESPVKLA